MSVERNALRAAEVFRRHRPTGRDLSGRRFWTNMSFETGAFLAGGICLFLLLALEAALWPWPTWRGLRRETYGQIALGLLVLAPLSGLLLERYLAHRTPPGLSLRLSVRAAIWIAGSLPVLPFLLVPLGRRLLDHAPAWAVRPVAARLDLNAPPDTLPRGSPWRRFYTVEIFGLSLITTGFLLPLAGCLWLAIGGNRPAILAGCIILHLALAGCLALYAESDLRFSDQPRRRLRLAPWLCLLPQPVPFFTFLAVLRPEFEGPRSQTLVWSAYARRVGVGRHSQWLDLRLALQQRWEAGSWIERWVRPRGLEIPQPKGRVEAARKTWMRIKSLLLAVETALAAGLLMRRLGAGPAPDYDPLSHLSLRPWLIAVSVLAALGLLQAGLGTLCLLLRVSHLPRALDPPAAGLYLFITQAALAVGLLTGALAAHGNLRVLAALSFSAGALAALLTVLIAGLLFLGERSSQSEPLSAILIWLAVLVLLGSLPLVVFKWPNLAWAGVVLAMLAPVVDVLVGVRSLGWILHPFGWRDIFKKQLGMGVRVRLGLLTLMALLPLGGIAVPVWVWTSRAKEVRPRNLWE